MWFQGCPQRCPGCVSPHSWEFDESCRVSLDHIAAKLKFYSLLTDRLTISGGEPFAQPQFLKSVLLEARKLGYKDILVYSGLLYKDLKASFPDVLEQLDVLIDGPFREDLPTRLLWRGSSNQSFLILSHDPEMVRRYESLVLQEADVEPMQIVQSAGKTFVVGIPRDGKKLENL